MVRSCASSPSSLRFQRSRPPITAASIRSCSQRHGARRVPATTGASKSSDAPPSSAGAGSSGRAGVSSVSGGTQRSPEGGACGGAPETACGTSPRLRYSANRRAERPSAAQASSARKARPAGLGFCVPEAKCAGIPARTNASSSSGRYWNGDRSSTAALPVSVRRKDRSGVSRCRTQAVRPENGASGTAAAACGTP